MPSEKREQLPLSKAAEYLLEECRMVLPGIQALFGFQLIAVFNAGFDEKLTWLDRRLHLLAIALVAVAVGLIMTPAALHRQDDPNTVTDAFVRVSNRLLLWSMAPLALGITIDFYLICKIIIGGPIVAVFAAALLLLFVGLWFILPRYRSAQAARS
jgi:hypothetical protein